MKGYSLHIGLNYVDPNHYGGWDGKLNACENDARDMQKIMHALGYSTSTLIRTQASRDNVINNIKELASIANSGDIVQISYSGHGSQLPDLNSDEPDALDETWCLYDGQVIDDELRYLWSLFDNGVRIFVTSDSCNSGSIIKAVSISNPNNINPLYNTKATPLEIAQRAYYDNKSFYDDLLNNLPPEGSITIKASIKLLSGSQDHEFAYDGPYNSVFTAHLKKIWNAGKFSSNYALFHKKIQQSIGPKQVPNLMNLGISNPNFDNQTPFQI